MHHGACHEDTRRCRELFLPPKDLRHRHSCPPAFELEKDGISENYIPSLIEHSSRRARVAAEISHQLTMHSLASAAANSFDIGPSILEAGNASPANKPPSNKAKVGLHGDQELPNHWSTRAKPANVTEIAHAFQQFHFHTRKTTCSALQPRSSWKPRRPNSLADKLHGHQIIQIL